MENIELIFIKITMNNRNAFGGDQHLRIFMFLTQTGQHSQDVF